MRVVILLLHFIFVRSLKVYDGSKANVNYPRTATVNLDDPPKKRWETIIRKHRSELMPYLERWQQSLNHHKDIDQPAWTEAIQKNLDQDQIDELQGILATVNENTVNNTVSWTSILLFQAIYELGTPLACSQALTAAEDGTVLHARNLDYMVISPVIEITYIRGGNPLFMSPTYLGKIGINTGMKLGHWSFGQNTRILSNDTVKLALERLQKDGVVFTTFVRKLMEQDLSYNDVVRKLQALPLLRAMYFGVAGAGSYEGIVIARAPEPSFVLVQKLSKEEKKWFIFQTNDDWNQPPKDARRQSGINMLNALTQQKAAPMSILKMMRTKPVFLNSSNVLLVMMGPKSGQFCTVLGPQVKNDDTNVSEKCKLPEFRMSMSISKK